MMVWRHDLSVLFQPNPLAASSGVKQDCLVVVVGVPLNCASMRALCSGGIFASASAGMGSTPLLSVTEVVSQSPGWTFKGVTLSAASAAPAVRITMLRAFFVINLCLQRKSAVKGISFKETPILLIFQLN